MTAHAGAATMAAASSGGGAGGGSGASEARAKGLEAQALDPSEEVAVVPASAPLPRMMLADAAARGCAGTCEGGAGHAAGCCSTCGAIARLERRLSEWMDELRERMESASLLETGLPPAARATSPWTSVAPPHKPSLQSPQVRWGGDPPSAAGDALDLVGSEGMPSRRVGIRAKHSSGQTLWEASLKHDEYHARWDHSFDDRSAMQRRLSAVVDSGIFVGLIVSVISVNWFFVIAEVHHKAVSGDPTPIFVIAEIACAAIFSIELLLRIALDRINFFVGRDRAWNLLDFFLVASAWAEVAIRQVAGGESSLALSWMLVGRFARFVRIAKVLRFLRAARFFGHLRTMIMMIINSFESLFWIFVVLAALLTTFAVILTEGATQYLRSIDGLPSPHDRAVRQTCGDMFKSLYTLFKVVTGGADWGDTALVASYIGPGYFALVCIFIFFMTFSVVNIVTGVFVDGAIQMAQTDRTMMEDKKTKEKAATSSNLLQLLAEIDEDSSGHITLEELHQSFTRPDIRSFMHALEIDVIEADALFALLDSNGDGAVDIIEFVEGMTRLKGDARSLDIHMLILQNQKALQACSQLLNLLHPGHRSRSNSVHSSLHGRCFVRGLS